LSRDWREDLRKRSKERLGHLFKKQTKRHRERQGHREAEWERESHREREEWWKRLAAIERKEVLPKWAGVGSPSFERLRAERDRRADQRTSQSQIRLKTAPLWTSVSQWDRDAERKRQRRHKGYYMNPIQDEMVEGETGVFGVAGHVEELGRVLVLLVKAMGLSRVSDGTE
jgi:hypothetical protein